MNKPLLLLSIFLVLLTGLTRVAAQTLSSSPTISFSHGTGFNDNIADDGDGGSVNITDFNIQVIPINSSGAKLTADPLEHHAEDWNGPPMVTYGDMNPLYGWSIKSANGADFSLVSFDFNDWGDWGGGTYVVQAFRNGASLGTVTVGANTNNNMVRVASPGVLTSVFQNVDEVRVYELGGAGSWVGINNIRVASPVSPLPVTWLSFTARPEGNGVLLNWSTAKEQNTRDFEVQHGDGRSWNPVATINAAVNSNEEAHYNYRHTTLVSGMQYYRILQRDLDGKESYSKVLAVNVGGAENGFNVYPNPVVNRQITLEVEKEGKLQLFTSAGVQVLEKSLQPGVQQLQLPLLQKGFYLLKSGMKTERILVD